MKNNKLIILITIVFILIAGMVYNNNSFQKSQNNSILIQEDSEILKDEDNISNTTNVIDNENIEIDNKSTDNDIIKDINDKIFVHVCGAVKNEGVYEVDKSTRVYEVINLAGGMKKNASTDYINLAESLYDGEKIYIPTKQEILKNSENLLLEDNIENSNTNNLLDINKATKEQLMTLNGIGEGKAESIIKYREENGFFKSIEEIKNITGIKDGVYNKICDYIKV